ncbi:MAG: GTP-binding protein [Gammaproteobacteria bacterium]|nr:GTP-binding protein [Gammaproteobacteria bacterium]
MHSGRLDDVLTDARSWAHRAVDQQWFKPSDLEILEGLEVRSPATLFDPGSHRPLIAAFFGGTGVGKSSLLNRLAGESIAKTGVERPTSQEVSLYAHESIHFRALPNDVPLDQIRMGRHYHDDLRQVVWVDMPDIDSVDQNNRQLVLDWLPQIDVLIYVVSPERYRDDKGWRLLKEGGGDHAWIFVLNQFDRGEDVQLDDFKKLLAKTGFEDPIVLTTICKDPASFPVPDQFSTLEGILKEISHQHLLVQLESRAELMKFETAREAVKTLVERLGPESSDASRYENMWSSIWSDTVHDLMIGLEWPMRALVSLYTGREAQPIGRSMDLTHHADQESVKPTSEKPLLWDEWAEGRTEDAVTQLLVRLGEAGMPLLPARQLLEHWPQETSKTVLRQGQLMLRQALAEPGNKTQRGLMKLASAMSILLPVLAIAWASYQVVKGYYDSALHHLDYLGSDFAIHSLLLIGLAWLLPWFLFTRLKPSIEASALKGLRSGLRSGLHMAGDSMIPLLERFEIDRQNHIHQGLTLLGRLEGPKGGDDINQELAPLLQRMVPRV